MKVPEKIIPLLFVLLLVAAFLLGRFQAQAEFLKAGGRPLVNQASTQGVGQTPQQTAQSGQSPSGGALPDETWKKLLANPAASKGDENAPVTMVEFTDYQCPFCSRHFSDAQPQIEKEYVETGKVRYLIRDLPLPIHPNAPAAAEAARCAGDKGKYWEMHDVLFQKQGEWSSGNSTELFTRYAGDLGLNSGEFSSCLTGGKHTDAVNADLSLAQQVGASGTPAFFINGKIMIGAQPFSAFQQAIEAEL
ncbi:DsbA family protein [Patescibacteria group bacterium]|nr:DsbA family protein [Patescibacteria group bacterium]